MTEGIVYVLTNAAMPKMVKIGRTGNDIDQRLSQLYSTGVPLPFECAYAAKVADMDKVEKAFHNAFGPYRVNPKREFFSIEPEQAIGLLDLMKLEDMTPAVQQEAEQVDAEAKAAVEKFKKSRRPLINYLEMGIPIGGVLIFQDGTTTCKVFDGRQVEYQGKTQYLSVLTKQLLGVDRGVSGTKYWTFQGRCLSDIRDETYEDDG